MLRATGAMEAYDAENHLMLRWVSLFKGCVGPPVDMHAASCLRAITLSD